MASLLMIQLLRNLGRDIGGRIWRRVDSLGILSSVDSFICCVLFFLIQIYYEVGTDGARANIGGIRGERVIAGNAPGVFALVFC